MEILFFLGLIIVFFVLLGVLVAMIMLYRQTNSKIDVMNSRLIETSDLHDSKIDEIIKTNDLQGSKIDTINNNLIESKTYQSQTTEAFGEIKASIGGLTEASRHMEEVGKEISGLSDILKAPKLRGGFGELLLGDLLSQILTPKNYDLQHRFESGERVDAVIVLNAGMVPVDSKFPLESFQRLISSEEEEKSKYKREFNRVVKKHIDSIAQKYIRPDEGTFEFALMYIPAENVYYETIIKEEALGESTSLLNYGIQKRVIPVSPNCFYAYLQAIVMGLKGLQIEKQAFEIMQHLSSIEGDLDNFRSEYSTLGGHLDRAKKKYDEGSKSLDRFGDKLLLSIDSTSIPSETEINKLSSS